MKEQKDDVYVISSKLIGITRNGSYFYSVAIVINKKKYVLYISKEKNGKWIIDNDIPNLKLNKVQRKSIIERIKNDLPDFEGKSYIKNIVKRIEDLSKIRFEEDIKVNEDEIVLYFGNAYELFLTPFEDDEYIYYDGYLVVDLNNNKSHIKIVVISDNDDRIYYDYSTTQEETGTLIEVAERYCKKCYNKTLNELIHGIIKEEECNEQGF